MPGSTNAHRERFTNAQREIRAPIRRTSMCVSLSAGVMRIPPPGRSTMLPDVRYCVRPPATYCTPRSSCTLVFPTYTGIATPPPAVHADVQAEWFVVLANEDELSVPRRRLS